ncbi:MAG: hypothetical protein KGJ55_12445 [Gammaproteobacteria bacterium]|nr:hypothetical protein [Gammaproteobacteria bacterium]
MPFQAWRAGSPLPDYNARASSEAPLGGGIMVPLAHLWLPMLISAAGVFIASSVLHMVLKFWHMPDYGGFPNEDDVGAAIRNGNPAPGMYVIPYCRMEDMKKAETAEKFKRGPVGFMILRPSGPFNMGKNLVQWLVFCLVVSLFSAYVAGAALAPGAAWLQVFRIVGTVSFMTYGFTSLPAGIWWGQPWKTVVKDVIDGLIYGLVTGVIFAWLWPT